MTEKLRLEWRDPATLTPNPRNFRRHPEEQKKLLAAVIDEVGWAGCILFNEATGRIIDGHARQEEAIRRRDVAVPVLVGNWSEQEEVKILATFDPIAAMAQQVDDIYRDLLADVETDNEDLHAWLAAVESSLGVFSIAESEIPCLPDGDKPEYQQITFTLHDSQAEIVKAAIIKAKLSGIAATVNENSNGNALALICERYNDG